MKIPNHRCWKCGVTLRTNAQGEYKSLLCFKCKIKKKENHKMTQPKLEDMKLGDSYTPNKDSIIGRFIKKPRLMKIEYTFQGKGGQFTIEGKHPEYAENKEIEKATARTCQNCNTPCEVCSEE